MILLISSIKPETNSLSYNSDFWNSIFFTKQMTWWRNLFYETTFSGLKLYISSILYAPPAPNSSPRVTVLHAHPQIFPRHCDRALWIPMTHIESITILTEYKTIVRWGDHVTCWIRHFLMAESSHHDSYQSFKL